jgi:hypothetical protein
MERGNETGNVVALREHEGEMKQPTVIGEWQFLGRRSPCVEAHVVPSATVKIQK